MQGVFWDALFVSFGACFVVPVGGEGDDVDAGEVGEEEEQGYEVGQLEDRPGG